jgi:ankyrin repeat protein
MFLHKITTDILRYIERRGRDIPISLIDAGVDVSAHRYGSPPMHLAAAGGYLYIVKLLIDAGADVSVRDSRGRTAENEEKNTTMSTSSMR